MWGCTGVSLCKELKTIMAHWPCMNCKLTGNVEILRTEHWAFSYSGRGTGMWPDNNNFSILVETKAMLVIPNKTVFQTWQQIIWFQFRLYMRNFLHFVLIIKKLTTKLVIVKSLWKRLTVPFDVQPTQTLTNDCIFYCHRPKAYW